VSEIWNRQENTVLCPVQIYYNSYNWGLLEKSANLWNNIISSVTQSCVARCCWCIMGLVVARATGDLKWQTNCHPIIAPPSIGVLCLFLHCCNWAVIDWVHSVPSSKWVNLFSTWRLHVAWMYIWWVCTRAARKNPNPIACFPPSRNVT